MGVSIAYVVYIGASISLFYLIGKSVNVLEKALKQRLGKYKRGEVNSQDNTKKPGCTRKTPQLTTYPIDKPYYSQRPIPYRQFGL